MKKSSTYMIIAVVLFFITLALSRSGSIATIIIGFGAMIMILLSQNARSNEKKENKPNNIKNKPIIQVNPNNSSTVNKTTSLQSNTNISVSSTARDEEYIKYIMSNNSAVTRNEVVSFLSVVDIYDMSGDTMKTVELFDDFMMHIINSNDLLHSSMVSGFFCGLLGKNISLSDEMVNNLSGHYREIISKKIIENGGILPKKG